MKEKLKICLLNSVKYDCSFEFFQCSLAGQQFLFLQIIESMQLQFFKFYVFNYLLMQFNFFFF